LDWTCPKYKWYRFVLCILVNLMMITISFQVGSFMASLITYWIPNRIFVWKENGRFIVTSVEIAICNNNGNEPFLLYLSKITYVT
jgi:hypothetical protein